jgi:hypothetical protein
VARRTRAGAKVPSSLSQEAVIELGRLDAAGVRSAWERLRAMQAPPALSTDFLRRDVAYLEQAAPAGLLSSRLLQRLATVAAGVGPEKARAKVASPRIKPGSTLLREWKGRTYTVLALDRGFEMSGQRFTSLSDVARHITGAHWSGPRFFGLRRSGGRAERRGASGAPSHA